MITTTLALLLFRPVLEIVLRRGLSGSSVWTVFLEAKGSPLALRDPRLVYVSMFVAAAINFIVGVMYGRMIIEEPRNGKHCDS